MATIDYIGSGGSVGGDLGDSGNFSGSLASGDVLRIGPAAAANAAAQFSALSSTWLGGIEIQSNPIVFGTTTNFVAVQMIDDQELVINATTAKIALVNARNDPAKFRVVRAPTTDGDIVLAGKWELEGEMGPGSVTIFQHGTKGGALSAGYVVGANAKVTVNDGTTDVPTGTVSTINAGGTVVSGVNTGDVNVGGRLVTIDGSAAAMGDITIFSGGVVEHNANGNVDSVRGFGTGKFVDASNTPHTIGASGGVRIGLGGVFNPGNYSRFFGYEPDGPTSYLVLPGGARIDTTQVTISGFAMPGYA